MNPPINRNLLLDYKYFNDDPDIINIWAHGYSGGLYKLDERGPITVKHFKKDFLSNSNLWEQHTKTNQDMTIVLHSFNTGNEEKGNSYARDSSKELKDVTIIAPTEFLNVKTTMTEQIKNVTDKNNKKYTIGYGHLKETYIGDENGEKGSWIEFRNGVVTGHYSPDSGSKPGAKNGIRLIDRIQNWFH